MTAIGFHFTIISAIMGVSVLFIRCESKEQALDYAKEWARDNDADPTKVILGCLTSYDDGSVDDHQFTPNELEF